MNCWWSVGPSRPPRSAPCVALAFASFSEETYLFVGSQVRRFEGDRVRRGVLFCARRARRGDGRRRDAVPASARADAAQSVASRQDTKTHRSRATRTTTTTPAARYVCAKVPDAISGTLPSSVLDERGCGPGLMSFDGEKIIVARSDGPRPNTRRTSDGARWASTARRRR